MRIEIQRASNLGVLHQNLGIPADSRISITLVDSGLLEIWDLSTGDYFTASPFTSPPTIERACVDVPEWAQEIIGKSTDELLSEWGSRWREGAEEKRMTIFTELCFRGVDVLSETREHRRSWDRGERK